MHLLHFDAILYIVIAWFAHTHALSYTRWCAHFLHFIVANVVIFTNEHMDWEGDVKINNTKNYPENTLPVALKRPLRGHTFNSYQWYSYQLNGFVFFLFGYMFNQPLFDFITHSIIPTRIECRFTLDFSFGSSISFYDSWHFNFLTAFQIRLFTYSKFEFALRLQNNYKVCGKFYNNKKSTRIKPKIVIRAAVWTFMFKRQL